jgi:hypothetical protein
MTRIGAAALALLWALSLPAAAEERREPLQPDWRGAAREALDQLGRALDGLEGVVERLPSYGMPYLDERGNIVIPRQDPTYRRPGDPDIAET